ncbi:Alpha/beta knot methyltransferase, partial [Tribonema minus]
VPSLAVLQRNDFAALSMTAAQWLPIEEVKPEDTRDYLRAAKRDGYCVVALEQTPSSQCLSAFSFPAKTLLLLGDEKRGVPAPLLAEATVCVQIPQRGVLRSLNAHVSGAIAMWEYCRQRM